MTVQPRPVSPFKFGGTEVAKGRVQPTRVVEALDIAGDAVSGFSAGRAQVTIEVDFERPEEAFDDGVVETVAPTAHAAADAVAGQFVLIARAGVLPAAIRVMDQTRDRAPGGQRHLERGQGQGRP